MHDPEITSGDDIVWSLGKLSGYSSSIFYRVASIKKHNAQMGILDVWHPDIEQFIIAKQTPQTLDKFNISVGITDGFMEAVEADSDWDLVFPDTNFGLYKTEWQGNISDWKQKGFPVVIHKTVRAKDLWDMITKATYTRNEPGVLFLDIANKMNTLASTETIATSNP